MATITILQAIITQIRDVQHTEDEQHPETHQRSEAFYDLGEAVWHIESAIRHMRLRSSGCPSSI